MKRAGKKSCPFFIQQVNGGVTILSEPEANSHQETIA